jgi:Predicted integral membrane protein (DUF2269)
MYLTLVYIHVVSAILSIGPFFVLFPFLSKMKSAEQSQLSIYIESFRFVVRLSKHAGHVLVASGVLLVWFSGWEWKTSWILATTIILVSSLYFIARAFSPLLRKLQDTELQDRTEIIDKLRKSLFIYIVLLFIMMWFMVVKPTLW